MTNQENKHRYNVLVFPGATEIGLEIFKSLCYCKNIQLFSAGELENNHASYVFNRHFFVPSVYDQNWLYVLNQVIINHEIDYIFPAHDDVIVALAKNQSKVKAKIVSSPLDTCLVTRSKSQTYQLFENKIPVPKLYKSIQDIENYPVFIKPDKGQGSQHTYCVKNQNQLKEILQQDREYIILEYLSEEEYTIDCFSDREKGLLFCDARQRIRTRNGISMNSKSVKKDLEIFNQYARIINSYLKLYGAWFFQIKKDKNGIHKLLEIAPRIPGTVAIQRVKGINLPLLSLYEQERISCEIMFNKLEVEIDRALTNRYRYNLNYTEVYLDLDDTLILNDQVNTNLIKFIYQCINKNIKIILITKHAGNLQETLKKHKLDNLFDTIIHLNQDDKKKNYINSKNSIFIDDSFSERLSVYRNNNIPTFDCSMIEMLLDDRM